MKKCINEEVQFLHRGRWNKIEFSGVDFSTWGAAWRGATDTLDQLVLYTYTKIDRFYGSTWSIYQATVNDRIWKYSILLSQSAWRSAAWRGATSAPEQLVLHKYTLIDQIDLINLWN